MIAGKTNAEFYLELFREHQPATAYDVIEVIKIMADDGEIEGLDAVGAFRMGQGVHGFCSHAIDDGKLVRAGTKLSDAGKEIWVYKIPDGTVAPQVSKSSKNYKALYEAEKKRADVLEQQLEASRAFAKCVARERDAARSSAALPT